MEFLPAAPREVRIARLREGLADLAFLDIAALVDAVAEDPALGARCVSVLTRRTPMAAHHVVGRPAAARPLESPTDLLRARYGGQQGSRFVAEHRALLRRLGGEDGEGPGLHAEMSYEAVFGALAAGDIDVAPDFAGLVPRYRRAVGPGRDIGVLRHSDAGVTAYGTGFVASAAGLGGRRGAIATFLAVVRATYERMAADPEAVVTAARAALPDLDREQALEEWHEEEREAIFGGGDAGTEPGPSQPAGGARAAVGTREPGGVGAGDGVPAHHRKGQPLDAGDSGGWAATLAWRREVWAVSSPPGAVPNPPDPGLLAAGPPG